MGNKTIFTVENGTTTITIGDLTIVTDGSVTIKTGKCGCSGEPGTPAPCDSQPEWIRDQETKFGFSPQESGGVVQFMPSNGIGEATTDLPSGIWAIQNSGGGIAANFTRSVLSAYQINSLSIIIESPEDGEEPIAIEASEYGSGINGIGSGSWQLQAGKSYCVTISPGYSVE